MDALLESQAEGVVTLTMNRPDRLNAMTLDMDSALRNAVCRWNQDSSCRVIVITGADKGFCSGADLSERLNGVPTEFDVAPQTEDRFRFNYLRQSRRPVIAAINGPAVGIGLALALYCDIRVVAPKAKLGLPYARLGLPAEFGVAWLLPRLIGNEQAAQLLLRAHLIEGTEAYRIGLATECSDNALARAKEIAVEIASSCGPHAVAQTRQLLWDGLATGFNSACRDSGQALLAARQTPEHVEALAAFRENRAPQFFTSDVP